MNELGEDASLTTRVRHPNWNTKTTVEIGRDTVVVYPETTRGNPLGASRVVRYHVLSRAEAFSDAATYEAGDLVVYLDDWLREAASFCAGQLLPISHRLFISVLEPDIFFPKNCLRLIDCVYVGRAGSRAKLFPRHRPIWRFRITNRRPSSREGLAALLRRTRILYTYDRGSALPFEASICGAQVQVVTDDGGLESSQPWETHALVRQWWEAGPHNVRAFLGLVNERWQDRHAHPFQT